MCLLHRRTGPLQEGSAARTIKHQTRPEQASPDRKPHTAVQLGCGAPPPTAERDRKQKERKRAGSRSAEPGGGQGASQGQCQRRRRDEVQEETGRTGRPAPGRGRTAKRVKDHSRAEQGNQARGSQVQEDPTGRPGTGRECQAQHPTRGRQASGRNSFKGGSSKGIEEGPEVAHGRLPKARTSTA